MSKTTQPRNEPLFHVYVENRQGKLLPVGPAVYKAVAEQFCHAIKQQIAAGREKSWSNPHIAQILNLH